MRRLLASANNEHALLTFESESLPPFANTGYQVKATNVKNPLELIEDNFTVTPGMTAPIGMIQSTLDGQIVNETYDPAGRLEKLVGKLGKDQMTSTITLDGLSRTRGIVDSNGLIGSFSYDALNRLTSVYWDGGRDENFSGKFSENLTYDVSGNISSIAREFGNFSYSYDPTQQLTATKYSGKELLGPEVNRSWQYDLSGNRANDSLRGAGYFIANGLVADGVRKRNEYTSDPDGFGNITEIENEQSEMVKHLTYRADGKLTSFDESREHGWRFDRDTKRKTKYFYDALGRRIAKQIGRVDDNDHRFCDLFRKIHRHEHIDSVSYTYLVNQDKILLARDEDGNHSLYLDGQGIDEHLGEIKNHRAKGYVSDHLGSTLNTEAAGSSHTFAAFGETLRGPARVSEHSPLLYGFQGRQLDPESNLYYFRNRMYDPIIGKMTSVDPMGISGGDTNFYRFVKNNPLRNKDPSGLTIYNATNVPGVPNSCGKTSTQTYFETAEASSTSVIVASGKGPPVPYNPNIYALTWGDINSSPAVNVDVNLSMNPSTQTLNNTLVHEGTHVLGGDEGVAYSVGDALYPQNSSP